MEHVRPLHENVEPFIYTNITIVELTIRMVMDVAFCVVVGHLNCMCLYFVSKTLQAENDIC